MTPGISGNAVATVGILVDQCDVARHRDLLIPFPACRCSPDAAKRNPGSPNPQRESGFRFAPSGLRSLDTFLHYCRRGLWVPARGRDDIILKSQYLKLTTTAQ